MPISAHSGMQLPLIAHLHRMLHCSFFSVVCESFSSHPFYFLEHNDLHNNNNDIPIAKLTSNNKTKNNDDKHIHFSTINLSQIYRLLIAFHGIGLNDAVMLLNSINEHTTSMSIDMACSEKEYIS